MKPGIYDDIPFDEYLAIGALSNTALGWLEQSPAVYLYRDRNPVKETTALRLGDAAHWRTQAPEVFFEREPGQAIPSPAALVASGKRFLLEPDPAVLAPDAKSPRATNAYKAAVAEFADAGLSVLKAEEWTAAKAIAAAFYEHPRIAHLLHEKLGTETTLVWQRDGILCKGRFDFYGDGWIGDLKTTRDIGGFSPWEITKWRIYRQMAWYRGGAIANDLTVDACYLAVVDSAPPHETALLAMDPAAMDAGDAECARLVALYQRCRTANHWPGRFPTEVLPGSITDRHFEQVFEDEDAA